MCRVMLLSVGSLLLSHPGLGPAMAELIVANIRKWYVPTINVHYNHIEINQNIHISLNNIYFVNFTL